MASSAQILRGAVDLLTYCEEFFEVVGWVCHEGGQRATGPLSFTLADQKCSGIELMFRPDLAEAGIAEGYAAFHAICPFRGVDTSQPLSLVIEDSSGGQAQIIVRAASIRRFRPVGSIELVTGSAVLGWLFDPRPGSTGMLLLDDQPVAVFSPQIVRSDLPFQTPGRQFRYGFELPLQSDILRHATSGQSKCSLVLSSSGYALAEMEILFDNSGVLKKIIRRPLRYRRVPTSKFLHSHATL